MSCVNMLKIQSQTICCHQNVNMYKLVSTALHYIRATTYLPQFPLTSSFICAGKLSPGFLANVTQDISVYRLTWHCLYPSKMCVQSHLMLLTRCSLQRHSWGHHGVGDFTQGWRRLPLCGTRGDVPVVCAGCISHPHPSWRQVSVCLKSTGIPKGLWKTGSKGEAQKR